MPVHASMRNARWELSERDDIRPAVRSGLKSVTFFALLGKNGWILAFLGLLGEFCLGLAVGGVLLGEFCLGLVVGGVLLGEFCTGWRQKRAVSASTPRCNNGYNASPQHQQSHHWPSHPPLAPRRRQQPEVAISR